MPGCNAGVSAKMQRKQPGITFTHCIARKLGLAVFESIKSETYLEQLQSAMSATFLSYYSPKKYRKEIKKYSISLTLLLNNLMS